MAEYIIANGQTLSNQTFGYGDTITVENGGTLSNAVIPKTVESVTLEDGAILTGSIRTAKEFSVSGSVDAASADLELDISARKPEENIFLNSLFGTQSISITVSPDQDKGTYRLFGDAAGFTGTITVKSSLGSMLGTLSFDNNVLDYDITRYTLSLNEANEVCVTISSNIPDTSDYVLLYKGDELVATAKSVDGITISAEGEYDHVIVLKGGVASNCVLASDGLLTVMAGGVVTDLDQQGDGALRFNYTAGDTTVITGTNRFGEFSLSNDVMSNVYGENVSINGNVTVNEYNSQGYLTVGNGTVVSGTLNNRNESYLNLNSGGTFSNVSIKGEGSTFLAYSGAVVENSDLYFEHFGTVVFLPGALVRNTTIEGPGVTRLSGGTYSEVTVQILSTWEEGFILANGITLDGSLTVKTPFAGYWGGPIDAAGNTIILDYTERNVTTKAMIDMAHVTEDVMFQINMAGKQKIGTYSIATGAKTFTDTFVLCVDGVIINQEAPLCAANTSFDDGSRVYTMAWDPDAKTLSLTIDISPDADSSYNILYWDKDGNYYHAASLDGIAVGSEEYDTVIVRNGGILQNATLLDGALLTVMAGGVVTDLDQQGDGALRFNYTAGDTTVITGTNRFGEFSLSNDVMSNVYGENVSINGNVTVNEYNSQGYLTVGNGTVISGTLNNRNESYLNLNDGGTFSNVSIKGEGSTFLAYSGAVVENSDLYFEHFGTVDFLPGALVRNTTIEGPGVTRFSGGTYSEVTVQILSSWEEGFILANGIVLDGSLTVKTPFAGYWGGPVNAAGNTIILDYTERNVTTKAMIDMAHVSEDVMFQINMTGNQEIGTYKIATGTANFIDIFQVKIDDTILDGTITAANPSLTYDHKTYTMTLDAETQILSLTVDIASDAGPDYNVLYWDKNGAFHHTASLNDITVGSDDYYTVTVRNGGILQNATLLDGALLTVMAGGVVTDLDQQGDGALRFNYTAGDTTVITGTNRFGEFSLSNDVMSNVYGENVSINGNVTVNEYNSQGYLTVGNGTVISGTLNNRNESYLNLNDGGTFSNVSIKGEGSTFLAYSGAVVENSDLYFEHFGTVDFLPGALVRNTTIEGPGVTRLSGGTYSEVTVQILSSWEEGFILANGIVLDGSLTVKTPFAGYWGGPVNAAGNTIILDYTERNVTTKAMIDVEHVRNAELLVTLRHDQTVGSYKLATQASRIGTGDPKGFYNWDTNKWDFKGEAIGDTDGIIEVRDENGILLANCTVNGDTEYFGRYNYTVRVDDNGDMYLDIGWNTREGRTYAADGYDNLTLSTAATLPEAGTKLTIDSASDVDWFRITLDTMGRKSSYIGIDFKQWAGDLDLYLYDANGNQLDYAKSVTDNERISLKGLAAGDYYVKVVGYEGNINEYKLAYKLPEPIALTDDYENGDDKAHSYHLGKLSEQITLNASISRADDQDYYKIHLQKKGLTCDTITLTCDDDFGDLDLYLYGSDGMTLLATSLSTSGGLEQISLAGLKHGEYYVAVKSKDGSVGNYQLSFDVNAHEVNPDKDENNDTLKKATDLRTPNGHETRTGLSIHQNESKNGKDAEPDVDYYKFSILEKGSADDWISISYEVCLGDLDLEILNSDGEVVAYSRTAENEDTVSLKGFEVGDYYIRVSGYNNVANNYTLSWNVTNSSLIPSDSYEGMEPIAIRENQTITGLSIAKPVKDDETRADTFKITLDYTGWKRSKIILTDYRSDWEDGMAYVLKDADGNILKEGTDSEISLAGYAAGEYYLTVDTPNEDEYSEYSLIAQCLPDSDTPKDNTWSFFIYLAGDNNLEGAYLTELLYMQQAILPENVEVYVLLDRSEGYSPAQRDWTDTRVGKIRHSKGGAVAVEWMYFDGINTNTYMNTQNLELKQEWDTGDISTLEAFLDWGMRVGRADNYALIMKDHGSSLGYNCMDDDSGSILVIDEIAELLKDKKYKDLSVVAFDQCLMGSDVVISTMEGTVDYVVASEAVGWTPNLLVMYKVLLNSLETEMTAQEVSQKIVAACNCSGIVDLTSASFHTSDHTLSEALQAFGEAAKGFTRNDWVAVCKSFALAYNYGDKNWAYSDLGFFLSTLKEYSTSISETLMDATETLYDVVLNQVVESIMITPTAYGSGLAVFNPVLSHDVISYYVTGIGQTAWGDFLYTAGQLAEDCTEYFVDTRTNLTFTDFSYSIEDEAVQVTYNLGPFYGNGVEYNGLYMDKKAYFTISLDKAGMEGDAIHVVADNPDANITIKLIQTEWTPTGSEKTVRRTSLNGVLSLAGVDPVKAGVDTEYDLIITSDRETTYSLSFVADWSSGSDYFDYTRSGSLGAQGNGSIEKATKLAAGNYGGLVTYAGDPDFYQLNTVYSDTLSVTVNGTGLTVQEYDASGLLVQTAEYADGAYTIIIANGNYLRVEGDADLAANEVNSYSLYISDVSSTYLTLGGTEIQLPEKPDVAGELDGNQFVVTVNVEDGMKGYQSSDLQVWTLCENNAFVATDNGLYYFKSVNPETNLESKYVSLSVAGIDHVLPTVSNVAADITTLTNTDVIVTAEFADDVALASSLYRIGEDGEWTDYADGVTVTENATVYFKAVDLAGNESEIASYVVGNIDKAPPVITLIGDTQTPVRQAMVTALVDDGSEIFYSTDQSAWTKYEGAFVVSANGTYYFKATDTADNTGTNQITFANIDRVAPAKPLVSADVTTATNQPVTVTAQFSTDSVVRQYSLDGETWLDYTAPLVFTENGIASFLCADAAGNYTYTTCAVTNIDTTLPAKPVAYSDMTTATNQPVTITAVFSADSKKREYSLDGETWNDYTGAISLTENGTVYFRGTDEAGNASEVTPFEVTNIDKVAPEKPTVSANIATLTNTDVLVTAVFSADSVRKEYSLDGMNWLNYTEAVRFTENGSVSFRGIDAAGNISEPAGWMVDNIDKEKPVIILTGDNATPLQAGALSASTEAGLDLFVSTDNSTWTKYAGEIAVSANATYYFKATDAAGNTGTAEITFANIDNTAPGAPSGLQAVVSDQTASLTWSESTDDRSGIKEYVVSYSLDGQAFTARTSGTSLVLNDAASGTWNWSVQAVDFAGNESAATAGDTFTVIGFKPYVVEYSSDNFEHVIRFNVTSPTLDSFRMPGGTYQLRVRAEDGSEWLTDDSIVAAELDTTPQLIRSDADGNADVFFANAVGVWGNGYLSQHVGSINDWNGTNEYAAVFGRNMLADIFEGSTDANILLLTDDSNGDALFVDDIYSDSPDELGQIQSRIAQIHEIRAGAGADLVDMTSQQFEYIGSGLTIRGGDGDDTIWANKGSNKLFGDAGNDRIVGASGSDVIAGGAGNDRMHGGGGSDVFTFCENWGKDNVEQLASGTVTLWFASGSLANWNAGTLTYTDGENSVKVSGVTADRVELKFGDDGSDRFAVLTAAGAFFDATTERIFEESGKGILASL